jgi:hypothetical protein
VLVRTVKLQNMAHGIEGRLHLVSLRVPGASKLVEKEFIEGQRILAGKLRLHQELDLGEERRMIDLLGEEWV